MKAQRSTDWLAVQRRYLPPGGDPPGLGIEELKKVGLELSPCTGDKDPLSTPGGPVSCIACRNHLWQRKIKDFM